MYKARSSKFAHSVALASVDLAKFILSRCRPTAFTISDLQIEIVRLGKNIDCGIVVQPILLQNDANNQYGLLADTGQSCTHCNKVLIIYNLFSESHLFINPVLLYQSSHRLLVSSSSLEDGLSIIAFLW